MDFQPFLGKTQYYNASSVKRYNCGECDKSFLLNEQLQRHGRRVHSGKSYQCNMCDFTTSWLESLKTHYRFKHPNRSQSKQTMASSRMEVDSEENESLYVSDEDDSESEEESNVPYISDEDESEEENDTPYVSDEKADDNVTLKRKIQTLNHIRRLEANKRSEFLKDCSSECIHTICEACYHLLNGVIPMADLDHIKKML